jgi:protein phosphatase
MADFPGMRSSVALSLISAVVDARDIRWRVTTEEISLQNLRLLIDTVIDLLNAEPAVLELHTDLCVLGDIHGNVDCLLHLLARTGWPPTRKYLFLGDYVDRGDYSCEVMILLYSLKVLYPQHVFLLRGNHESKDVSMTFGFPEECIQKFSVEIYQQFLISFGALPVAAIANAWFCTHGGICQNVMTIGDLCIIEKVKNVNDSPTIADLLWSDPSDGCVGFIPNPRGCGKQFGRDTVEQFLTKCHLIGIIRGHQMCDGGYNWPFSEEGGVLTVFSSYDYCGYMNDAASVHLSKDGRPTIVVLPPQLDLKMCPSRMPRPSWMITMATPDPEIDLLIGTRINEALDKTVS